MARNYDNYGYDEEKSSYRTSLIRRVLVIIMMLIAIVLIIYLLKSCRSKRSNDITPSTNINTNTNNNQTYSYEDELIVAGKEYYLRHSGELPNSPGDCSLVELEKLLNENLIDSVKFGSCNINTTYLKVCLLNNGERQYVTKLTCVNRKTY